MYDGSGHYWVELKNHDMRSVELERDKRYSREEVIKQALKENAITREDIEGVHYCTCNVDYHEPVMELEDD